MDGSLPISTLDNCDLQQEYAYMDSGEAAAYAVSVGCSPLSLFNCGHIASTTAFIEGDIFTPSEIGDRTLIVLPFYEGRIPNAANADDLEEWELHPADLIAWEPAKPKRWYFRTKSNPKAMLGDLNLHGAKLSQLSPTRYTTPLTVFGSPLEWLCAGGTGVCPLTISAMRDLRGLKDIYCPDRNYALKLDAELRKQDPEIPSIHVPKGH